MYTYVLLFNFQVSFSQFLDSVADPEMGWEGGGGVITFYCLYFFSKKPFPKPILLSIFLRFGSGGLTPPPHRESATVWIKYPFHLELRLGSKFYITYYGVNNESECR